MRVCSQFFRITMGGFLKATKIGLTLGVLMNFWLSSSFLKVVPNFRSVGSGQLSADLM